MLPLLLLLAAAPLARPADREVVDRVAALVNGQVITLSEIVERAGPDWERIAGMEPGAAREKERGELIRRVFDLLVSEKLLQAEAVTLQVDATDAQVTQAIAEIKERNRFDDAQLAKALEEQGLDQAAFRAQIKRDLDTYLVLQYRLRNRVKISDEDLRNYYQAHPQEFAGEDEVKVLHVFLPLADGASNAERERVQAEAAKLAARARAGEDFVALAKAHSKGPSASDGGDLGWLRRGTLDPAFEDAAFALQAGQVSAPVKAGPGIHVIKVAERRVGGGRAFEQAKEEIRQRLFEKQAEGYRQQYVADLRRLALVEPKLAELAQN